MPRPASSRSRASPLDEHLGFWLRYVSNHVSARFAKLLEAHGTTVTEWVALRTLYERPHTTHAELIATLGMTKGAASKIVSRLEQKGWAQRPLAAGSARAQSLRLTRSGLALVPLLAAAADANEVHFFGHLGAAERRALTSALQHLVAHHRMTQLPLA